VEGFNPVGVGWSLDTPFRKKAARVKEGKKGVCQWQKGGSTLRRGSNSYATWGRSLSHQEKSVPPEKKFEGGDFKVEPTAG